MKTLLLLDIAPTHRPKLEVWKDRHGVRTQCLNDPENPWIALAYEDTIKFGYGAKDGMSIGELGAYVGRLITEAGYDGWGQTEEAACYALAQKMRWPFLESVTEEQCRLPAHRPMPDVPELLEGVRL